MNVADLETRIQSSLAGSRPLEARLQDAVEEIARAFDARTCTLHRFDPEAKNLHLVAQVGLPPHIREITREIPVGKGMAGICAQRREPVTVCNLQTDDSGVARPAARDTRVSGALVVPALRGEALVATLGVGKAEDHEYSPDEIALLSRCAGLISNAW